MPNWLINRQTELGNSAPVDDNRLIAIANEMNWFYRIIRKRLPTLVEAKGILRMHGNTVEESVVGTVSNG